MIRVSPEDAAASSEAFVCAPVELAGLVFRGPDRKAFLHGLLTADVKALATGGWTPAYYLTPKGRLVAQLGLYDRGDDLLALARPAEAEAIERGLSKPVVLTQTRIERLAQTSFWAAAGPEAPAGGLPSRLFGPCRLFLGEGPAGRRVEPGVLEALRVLAGVAGPGDVDAETFPLELGSEEGISFDKGCYLGQETTAKMRNLGRPNRRLARLSLEGAVAEGATLSAGGEFVGRMTSPVEVPGAGAIGLALLKTAAASAGTRLSAAGGGSALVLG